MLIGTSLIQEKRAKEEERFDKTASYIGDGKEERYKKTLRRTKRGAANSGKRIKGI